MVPVFLDDRLDDQSVGELAFFDNSIECRCANNPFVRTSFASTFLAADYLYEI
jgi:hypothetical protein